jgi:hypothetical protein
VRTTVAPPSTPPQPPTTPRPPALTAPRGAGLHRLRQHQARARPLSSHPCQLSGAPPLPPAPPKGAVADGNPPHALPDERSTPLRLIPLTGRCSRSWSRRPLPTFPRRSLTPHHPSAIVTPPTLTGPQPGPMPLADRWSLRAGGRQSAWSERVSHGPRGVWPTSNAGAGCRGGRLDRRAVAVATTGGRSAPCPRGAPRA